MPMSKQIMVRVLYLLLVGGCLLAVAFLLQDGRLELKDVGVGILALIGTVVGATIAFRLNADRENMRELAAQRMALNRSLFTIARQWNALRLLEKHVEPYKSDFELAFNFPATKPPPYEDLVHRFDDLDFLLGAGEANLLFKLSIEQERFHQVIAALEQRNMLHVQELQPAIAKLGLKAKLIKVRRPGWSGGEAAAAPR